MAYKHETTRRVESELFEGVSFVLKKMTEGRRIQLRTLLNKHNIRIREILREQAAIEATSEETRDVPKWLELQEEFDSIMLEHINPTWIEWGVKMIDGLESDGNPLTTAEWRDWPSALVAEVVAAVKAESELNGAERKNSELPTTSGALVGGNQKPTTVEHAEKEASGALAIVVPTSQPN